MSHVLRIRARRRRRSDGREVCHLTVLCPRRGHTIALSSCSECGEASGICAGLADPDRHLVCGNAEPPPTRSPLGRQVHEIMHGDVLSVSQDSPTYDVHGMLVEGSVDLVPVADDDGTLRGVVTKTDLLRSANLAEWSTERRVSWRDLLPWRRERQRLVEAAFVADVMMPTPSVIEETSSIAVALERFARDRGRVLPVVSASGALVGMLEAAQVFVACLGADQTLPSGANPLPVR